jgi:probable F420-dependent oxidoreductase
MQDTGGAAAGNRAFRFGLVYRPLPSPMEWPGLVREVEALGYDTLLLSDHLDGQYAIGPALGSAASLVPRLQFGSLVYCNDFYHPLILAREAATLDQISGGRFQLGLGAGWNSSDYARSGLPFGPASERIDRLAESVRIIRHCFDGEPFTFTGKYYELNVDRPPVPELPPLGPPSILIGGGGRKILRMAGELADIVQVNPRMSGDSEGLSMFSPANSEAGTAEKIAWIREGAADRAEDIELSVTVYAAMVTDDRDRAARYLARRANANANVSEVLACSHALIGSVNEIADTLRRRRDELGISYIVIDEWHRHTLAPVVELLAGS